MNTTSATYPCLAVAFLNTAIVQGREHFGNAWNVAKYLTENGWMIEGNADQVAYVAARMRPRVQLGSIIHGTHRPEDLIPVLADELERLDAADMSYVETIKRARGIEDFESDEASAVLNDELFEALNAHAPAYCYFGAHPGDGSDFGFWFDHDAFEDARRYGEVATGSDLEEARADATDGTQVLAVISDHGNVDVYDLQGVHLIGVV